MNQTCKVCGEPAAGFHFGAFTCEGCKSFFGRSYNNLSVITECKNNGECVINKKNRTSCKACRLRKCLMVGMSKSGSRYGRRSNWFKIHCLLQEQQQHQAQQQQQQQQQPLQRQTPPQQPQPSASLAPSLRAPRRPSPPHAPPLNGLGLPFHSSLLHLPKTREELILLGLDEYKNAASPSVSSPESHNSDSSVEVGDGRRMPLFPGLIPSPFIPPHSLLFPAGYHPLYPGLLQPATNNNSRFVPNHNAGLENYSKRVFLDAVLQSQRTPTPELPVPADSPIQEEAMDLSMKTSSERGSSPTASERSTAVAASDADEESICDSDKEMEEVGVPRPSPLDLTTKL